MENFCVCSGQQHVDGNTQCPYDYPVAIALDELCGVSGEKKKRDGEEAGNTKDQPPLKVGENGEKKKTKRDNQVRHWLATVKVTPTNDKWTVWRDCLNDFCCDWTFQKEKGDKTDYEHWQIYLKLTNERGYRMQQVKNLLGESTAHLEPCKSFREARAYCRKPETRVSGPYDQFTKEEGEQYSQYEYFIRTAYWRRYMTPERMMHFLNAENDL